MKKALIVGFSGQDGTYLWKLLNSLKYELVGISSNETRSAKERSYSWINILDKEEVTKLVKDYLPDEIYYLAAVHQSSSDNQMEDGELFQKSIDINVKAFVNFIESVRLYSKNTQLFYAASSHIFGDTSETIQTEESLLNPDCIYGITKAMGTRVCRFYREHHGIFASVGIFYNHESPLRESKYVSKKIVETAVAIKYGLRKELVLGNLDSKIDWGYAPDYVNAAQRILQLEFPGDFIISSGERHTIKNFVANVFELLNLEADKYIRIDPALITKKQKQNLFGNNEKLKLATGWQPGVDFKGLIKILVEEELKKYALQ